jgi:hypothetical protein
MNTLRVAILSLVVAVLFPTDWLIDRVDRFRRDE